MNPVFTFLFAVGILFAIYAGVVNTSDLAAVQRDLAALQSAVDQVPAVGDPALTERLAAVSAALDPLAPDKVRLPRVLEAYLKTMREDLAEVRAEPTPAGLDDLRDLMGTIARYPLPSQFGLMMTSLGVQGRAINQALFDMADLAVMEVALKLIGIMALWMGIMRVAEKAGLVQAVARLIQPILRFLFPKIPRDHPANGSIVMAISAFLLGLDNASTPLAIKAMQEMQTLSRDKETITNDQATFMAISTAGFVILPFTIIGYRVAFGSRMPNDVILPILIASAVSTIVAITMSKILQGLSTDPAHTGEEAERITREILAALENEGKGVKS